MRVGFAFSVRTLSIRFHETRSSWVISLCGGFVALKEHIQPWSRQRLPAMRLAKPKFCGIIQMRNQKLIKNLNDTILQIHCKFAIRVVGCVCCFCYAWFFIQDRKTTTILWALLTYFLLLNRLIGTRSLWLCCCLCLSIGPERKRCAGDRQLSDFSTNCEYSDKQKKGDRDGSTWFCQRTTLI